MIRFAAQQHTARLAPATLYHPCELGEDGEAPSGQLWGTLEAFGLPGNLVLRLQRAESPGTRGKEAERAGMGWEGWAGGA